jgi:hypothetical protein
MTTTQIDTRSLGIQDIDALVKSGEMKPAFALGVVEERIAKRKRENKPQILRVVQFRNSLAAQLGAPPMPEPLYQKKATQMAALPTDPEALAKALLAAGVDSSALVAQITKLAASK